MALLHAVLNDVAEFMDSRCTGYRFVLEVLECSQPIKAVDSKLFKVILIADTIQCRLRISGEDGLSSSRHNNLRALRLSAVDIE